MILEEIIEAVNEKSNLFTSFSAIKRKAISKGIKGIGARLIAICADRGTVVS
jgi:hypothetical protein